HRTFGLPVVLTHGTNTFGPWQFPEKFIPMMIISAIRGNPLPIYGRGENVRDWLFVEDHVDALWRVFNTGTIGEAYNIGGRNEYPNHKIAGRICELLDRILPESVHRPHEQLITFVPDRPGHDFRYAINTTKIKQELSWQPRYDFDAALELCVLWYLHN